MRSSLLKPVAMICAPPFRQLVSKTSSDLQETQFLNLQYERQYPLPRQHSWNRSVASAEKLVGFPTSAFQIQALMKDDVTSLAEHFRRIMGSDHPILKTVKRLVHQEGMMNLQVRGLMLLLIARATATERIEEMYDYDPQHGFVERHRKLAEIIEMIQSTKAIHKSVLNLPVKLPEDKNSPSMQEDLDQLEYGNKLAILAGDYLLAIASARLAALRNTYITESIAVSIAEFSQSEFLGRRDVQGRFIPDASEHLTTDSWLLRNQLGQGSLLGKGCKSIGILSELPDEMNERLDRLGSNVALALQAFVEIGPYVDGSHPPLTVTGQAIDLSSAPVLFHLESDLDLLTYIKNCQYNNVDNLDAGEIFLAVKSGNGIAKTQDLMKQLSSRCFEDIDTFPDSDAKCELRNLLMHMSG